MPDQQINIQNVVSQIHSRYENDLLIRDSFRRWHFDALSDDASESVIIDFWDNYVFSPRYLTETDSATDLRRFPAVSFLYCVNGRAIFHTINEFSARHLSVADGGSKCTIGMNEFSVVSIEYGSGYVVSVDFPLGPRRRLRGSFEWLSVDADLSINDKTAKNIIPLWNIPVPRSDVTGRIEIIGDNGRVDNVVHFRGSGYHDQVHASESFFDTYRSKHWGRVHFADKTVVFSNDDRVTESTTTCRLIVIQDGLISESKADCREVEIRRDRFGMKYPGRITFRTEDGSQLIVKARRLLDSNPLQVRGLAQMVFSCGDGAIQTATGVFEYIKPRKVKNRIFRWLVGRPIKKID